MNIEDIAEKLARSLGHQLHCRKVLAVCTCESGQEQAEALDLYEHWKREKQEKT